MSATPQTDVSQKVRTNPATGQPQPVLTTQEAREGATGHNVRYVLGYGLGGVVLAFLIVYFVYFH
jgi:hypothetical protein